MYVCMYVAGQRSKKHFLWFFYFRVLCRKIMVLAGFKGQKNTSFRVEYRKGTDCSSSKVMGRISETMSIETSRCYVFAHDHIDWQMNQSRWRTRKIDQSDWGILKSDQSDCLASWFQPIRYFCPLALVQSDFFTSGVQPNRYFCLLILSQSRDFTIGLAFNQVFQVASSANQSFSGWEVC
jgi:hypothetical protein